MHLHLNAKKIVKCGAGVSRRRRMKKKLLKFTPRTWLWDSTYRATVLPRPLSRCGSFVRGESLSGDERSSVLRSIPGRVVLATCYCTCMQFMLVSSLLVTSLSALYVVFSAFAMSLKVIWLIIHDYSSMRTGEHISISLLSFGFLLSALARHVSAYAVVCVVCVFGGACPLITER
eukprot:scaffold2786_cov39-Tisochrysis_lutea.AAC.1